MGGRPRRATAVDSSVANSLNPPTSHSIHPTHSIPLLVYLPVPTSLPYKRLLFRFGGHGLQRKSRLGARTTHVYQTSPR